MNYRTFKDFSTKKELPLREKFIRGDVLRIGQLVEDNIGQYEILDRGTNYLTCSDINGIIVKKFITEVTSIPKRPNIDTIGCFKGLITEISDPIAHACFESTIYKYNNGQIVDAIAIIKSLKAYENGDIESLKTSLTRINEIDNHLYLKENMDNIKQNDRLKVATVIADTLGVAITGSSPEALVNNALRNARKNSMMIRGESLKIITRMLELAKSVGIKYDESIIKLPEPVNEADKTDSVELDIPLFIRILELAREEIKSDADLHSMVERMIAMRESGMLTMDNYKDIARGIVSESLDEAHKINSKVEIIRGSGKGIVGRIGEIRRGAPKMYTVFHGEHNAIQVSKGHFRAIKESESLEELSSTTLASYKKKAGMAASIADTTAAGANKEGNRDMVKHWTDRANKKFSGIMTATKKQFHNDLKENEMVSVDHDSGKKLYGKFKGMHGSVAQVQYNNGKMGYHHSHKVTPVDHPEHNDEFVNLTEPKLSPENIDKKPGHSLGGRNNTIRHMLVNKLREH